jgi:hypothetical protein
MLDMEVCAKSTRRPAGGLWGAAAAVVLSMQQTVCKTPQQPNSRSHMHDQQQITQEMKLHLTIKHEARGS